MDWEIYLLLIITVTLFVALIYYVGLYLALLSVSRQKDKSAALIMLLNNMAFLGPKRIKKLIKKGADVNFIYYVLEEKHSPLVKAILNNCNIKIIAELIQNGADTKLLMTNHTNLLMLAAAFYKNPQIIRLLLETGLDINHQNENGSSALIYAVKFNQNPKFVQELIKQGADIEHEDGTCRKAQSYLEENPKLNKSKICKSCLKA